MLRVKVPSKEQNCSFLDNFNILPSVPFITDSKKIWIDDEKNLGCMSIKEETVFR